ncbi:MAG: hypothetical protein AAGG07_00740 [Planctomycetota bacterium]
MRADLDTVEPIPLPPRLIPGLWGAELTLRDRGRPIAVGAAQRSAEFPDPIQPALRALHDSIPAGPRVPAGSLEIELASAPIPVTSEQLMRAEYAPGSVGVAVRRRGATNWATAFPFRQIESGLTPAVAAEVLLRSLDESGAGELLSLPQLVERNNAELGVFSTIQLAQPARDDTPRFLTRGTSVVPSDAITHAAIVEHADGLARHLLIRLSNEQAGLLPSTESMNTARVTGPPRDASKAALALALARYARSPAAVPASAIESRAAARRVASSILTDEPPEPRVAALLAATHRELGDASPYDADHAALLRDALALAFRPSRGFDPSISDPASRSVIAFGLASLADAGEGRGLARAALGRLYLETDPPALVAATPWVVYAERVLAPEGEPIPAADALRELRRSIGVFRLSPLNSDIQRLARGPLDPLDRGGIALGQGPAARWPTWSGLRPIAFNAAMLADSRLTPRQELPRHLGAQLESTRFLRQLAVRPIDLRLADRPEHQRWGIRAAIWSPDLPLDASTLALMALCDTLETLD